MIPPWKSLALLGALGVAAGLLAAWPAGRLPRARTGWAAVGATGLEPGRFNQPRGITAFPDGTFVVADRSARVQQFSAEGRPLRLWTMQDHALGNPKGLCALPDGNLLVCDTHYGRVLELTLDGAIVREWGGTGKEPGQFVHPLACAVDGRAGFAYVVEYGSYNDRVQKFQLDGTFVKAWGAFGAEPGELSRPSGVAVDAHGDVYVADACNHRIQKFDPDGKVLAVFGGLGSEPGQLRYPYDVACAPDGTVYVAEFNNHRVSVFDGAGTFLRLYGAPGEGPGEFKCPWSLTVDAQGRLLVSDTGNGRVQILQVSRPADRTLSLAR